MKKKIILAAVIILGMMTTIGCGVKENNNETGKLRVAVTINPLREFTQIIGGDKVEVFSIIPDGADVHDSEPMPKALKNLSESNIFVYNGLNMEDWIDKILGTIEDKDIEVVNSSDGVDVIDLYEEDHSKESKEEHKGHNHGVQDPHVWLSLKEATRQAENIKNALILKDEVNKDYYEENFQNLKREFETTYEEYETKFNNVSNKKFATSHSAFAYIARDFGLTQVSIGDIYGEGESLAQDTKKMINYVKENNIKVVFSEASDSSRKAEAIAKEAGAKVETIYSLESKVDDISYLDGIKYNYEKIYEALK